MQRRAIAFLVLLAGLVTFAPGARGHHNSNAFYDFSRVAEVEGLVENVRWQNPHVIVEIKGMNESGVEELWKIEGEAVNSLQRKGVDVDSVKVGERVRVVGALSRYGRPEMFAGVLYLADGREVVLTDRIAVHFGVRQRVLSTGERISNAVGATSAAERRKGIFRVWSRNAVEGLPRASPQHTLTPAALAAKAAWDPLTDDPSLKCIAQGMPGVMVNPFPIQFVDEGERIVLRVEEWDTERIIFMSRDAAIDAPAAPLGHSVGRWDGDTLIVRTTKISWPNFDDVGTPQSAEMAIEERFTLTENGSRLEYVQTAVDPSTFTEPAVKKGYFWLEAGAEIKPYDCQLAD
jgi:hypothetical protein